jgi:hypothetical protein
MAPPGASRTLMAPQLQFELQFTRVQHRPWRSTHDGDMHWWTPMDVRKRKAADS